MDDEIEVIGKVADATKEIAKTGAKAIDLTSDGGRFLGSVFGDLVTDGVGLLADKLKYMRFERAVLLGEKAQERLAAKGITLTRPVPPKIALPLIENATLEDDDDLHSLWANLLASALDDDTAMVERKHVTVLADLTIDDAYTLIEIYENWQDPRYQDPSRDGTLTYGRSVDGIASHNAISIITLSRLGLIAPSYVEFKTYEPPGHDYRYGDYGPFSDPVRAYGDLEVVVMTPFGEAFCEAVILTPTPDE